MICAACLEPTSTSPCVGCGAEPRLDGRYTLLAPLGEGGSGMTWRADGPDGPVAVKEIPLRSLDRKAREMVDREARVLAQIVHPRVPRLHENLRLGVGRERALFLVQDLIEGETLEAEAGHRRYTEGEVCTIIAEVADILADLHARVPPLVHRDIKPANLIRRPDGSIVLVDFGSVRDVARDRQLGGSTVAGTFGYMAPEQFRGDASPASDVFGLGATAIRLLARQEPHHLQGWDQRMNWHRAVEVSPRLTALIDGMVELDETHRLDDAASVARQARALRDGHRQGDSTARLRGPDRTDEPAPPRLLAHPRRVDEVVQRLLERLLFLREGRLSRSGVAGPPVDPRERRMGLGLGMAVVAGVLCLLAVGSLYVAVGEGSPVRPASLLAAGPTAPDTATVAAWAHDLALDARDTAVRQCGEPLPRVVPLQAGRSGTAVPAVGVASSPAQRCWAAAVAPMVTDMPVQEGALLWVVPSADGFGSNGLRLVIAGEQWWLDPVSGVVTDWRGNPVVDVSMGDALPAGSP